jgi:2-polyprenyl-3-methyl-5-hydroxy-6-metoxy-1,4-benzoquinol methylase
MFKTIQQLSAYNKILGRGYDSQGVPRPFDEREFFEVSEEMGWNQNNPDYRDLFEVLSNYIIRLPHVHSSLEFGCGPGYLLYCLSKAGIDAAGLDGNKFSKRFFDQCHPEFSNKYFLDPTFSRSYKKSDLFISVECFEHIADDLLAEIMRKVRAEVQPTFILFSSTPFAESHPGWDLQWGHINIKQPNEWDDFFSQYGYQLTTDKPPVTSWAALYKKTGA